MAIKFKITFFFVFLLPVLFSCNKKDPQFHHDMTISDTTTIELKMPDSFPLVNTQFKKARLAGVSKWGSTYTVNFNPEDFSEDIAEQVIKELKKSGYSQFQDEVNGGGRFIIYKKDNHEVRFSIALENNKRRFIFVEYH